VRSLVQRSGEAFRQHGCKGGEAQDAGTQHEGDDHRHLDLEGLHLLAEVLRRPSHHQARDEHGQDGANDEHPVHPSADPAWP